MGFLAAHFFELLALAAVAVWGVIAAPHLLSRKSGTGAGIAALYVFGLSPAVNAAAVALGYDALAFTGGQITTAACLALGAIGFVSAVARRWRVTAVTGWLLAYLLVLMVSAAVNGSLNSAALGVAVVAFAILPLDLPLDTVAAHLRRILRVVMLASLALAAYDYEAVAFTDNLRTLFGLDQLAGATPHPNVLGPVAAFALAVELWRPAGRRSSVIVGVGAAVACCLLAQSRAGWVCAVAVLAIWLLARPATRGATVIAGYFAVLGVVAWLTWESLYGDAWDSITAWLADSPLTGRSHVWRLAYQEFERNPVLGGGPTVFGEEFRASHGQFGAVTGQAHNQVLETMAELGAVGLVIFLAMCLSWIVAAAKGRSRLPFAALAVLALTGLVEAPLRAGVTLPAFLVIATAVLLVSGLRSGGRDGRHSAATALPLERPGFDVEDTAVPRSR